MSRRIKLDRRADPPKGRLATLPFHEQVVQEFEHVDADTFHRFWVAMGNLESKTCEEILMPLSDKAQHEIMLGPKLRMKYKGEK